MTSKQLDERETILYDPLAEAIHVLNPTARLIWEACDGEHTPDDMAALIRAQYAGAEASDVLGDVQRTLDTFAAKGLLQPGGSG